MLVLGYLAIGYLMPKRFMPYVESPMLGIITEMPGLSAEEMETFFLVPYRTANGERLQCSLHSFRFARGFSMVTLEYPYGTDMQRAQVEVQSLLNVVQADLPGTGANLKPSWILKVDPLNLPVLTLSLRGDPEKGWTLERLRDLADNQIINRFRRRHIETFLQCRPFGGYRRQLQVQVDRDKLASFGISILDVRDAIDMYRRRRARGLA